MKTRRSSKTDSPVADDDAAMAATEVDEKPPSSKKPRLDIPGLTAGSFGLSPYYMQPEGDDGKPGAKKERKSDRELAAIARENPLNPGPRFAKLPILHSMAPSFAAAAAARQHPGPSIPAPAAAGRNWAFPPPNFNMNNIPMGMPGLSVMGNIPNSQRGLPLILPNAPLPSVQTDAVQQAILHGMRLAAQKQQSLEPTQDKKKDKNVSQPLYPLERPLGPPLFRGNPPSPSATTPPPPALPHEAAVASMNQSPNGEPAPEQFYLQPLNALGALYKKNPMLPSFPSPPNPNSALDILTEAADTAKPASLMPENVEGQPIKRIYIDEVARWDVLAGRGGAVNKHEGNERFRMVIWEMRDKYRQLLRGEKMDLSRAIVDCIEQYGGRFIKYDNEKGKWFIMTKSEAQEKTSRALREIR